MTTHYLLEEPNPQKKTSSKKAAIQRWCIIRSYGADPENPHLIIEVADASKALQKTLKTISGGESVSLTDKLAGLEQDDLDWWEESEVRIHESQAAFLKRLDDPEKLFKGVPLDKWSVEEGMVFLYVNDGSPHLVPFTYQARQMSKDLYQHLTGLKPAAQPDSRRNRRR